MQQRAQKQAQVKGLPNGAVNCSSTYTPILIRSKS
jgi:formate-dependent nitrite reductase cytochrome c552 subunit